MLPGSLRRVIPLMAAGLGMRGGTESAGSQRCRGASLPLGLRGSVFKSLNL